MLVASAKRGVLGGLAKDDVDDEESAEFDRTGVSFRAAGRLLSSVSVIATRLYVCEKIAIRKVHDVYGETTEVKKRRICLCSGTEARRLRIAQAICKTKYE